MGNHIYDKPDISGIILQDPLFAISASSLANFWSNSMSASTEQPSSKHASNRALTEISYEKCPFFQPLPRFLLCPCCFFISFFVGNWKQKWTFFQGTTFETFRKSPKTDTLWPHLPTTRWMKCPDSITPGWRHWWIPLLQGPARACFSTSRSRDHENNNKTAAWFGSWLPGW